MFRLPACALLLLLFSSPAFAGAGAGAGFGQGERVAGLRVRISPGGADPIPAYLASAYGVITSMYRSPAHNRAVGGVQNSYHLQGRAIDVARRPDITHRQIAAALLSAGYVLIESLDEGDHSHFAFGPSRKHLLGQARAGSAGSPWRAVEAEKPRLLADRHGALRLDLSRGAGGR